MGRHLPKKVYKINMKGDRDGKSATVSGTRNCSCSECIPVSAYIISSCFYDPLWVKNDIGTGIHNDHSLQLHYRKFLFPLVVGLHHFVPTAE